MVSYSFCNLVRKKIRKEKKKDDETYRPIIKNERKERKTNQLIYVRIKQIEEEKGTNTEKIMEKNEAKGH
jgi:hypothetical protein